MSSREETHGGVGPAGEDPGLVGVELAVQHAEVVGRLVSAQNLDRHQQRVQQLVTEGVGGNQ